MMTSVPEPGSLPLSFFRLGALVRKGFERGSKGESRAAAAGLARTGDAQKSARGNQVADGPKSLFLHEIESALKLQFKLRAFGQVHFVSAACFHQVGFQRCNRRVLGGFLRIFVL